MSSLEKRSIKESAYFLIRVFFDFEPPMLFVKFGDESLVSCIVCKYFLSFCGLSSLFNGFLCYAKAFKVNQIPLVYFCFYFHYSRRWVIDDLALIYVIECSAYVFL